MLKVSDELELLSKGLNWESSILPQAVKEVILELHRVPILLVVAFIGSSLAGEVHSEA